MSSDAPTTCKRDVVKLPHHEQQDFCTTRPAYRQGKKLTAVKVYTASSESQHLVVSNVPALGLASELKRLATRFGAVKSLVPAARFETEPFTDAFHLQYTRIASARHAKRQLDGRNFYGGLLLAAFAPEMESVAETRAKLDGRRRDVGRRAIRPITIRPRWRPLPSEEWPAADVLKSKRQQISAENPTSPSETLSTASVTTATVTLPTNAASTATTPNTAPPTNAGSTATTAIVPPRSSSLRLVPRQVTVKKRIVYRTDQAKS